MNVLVIYPNGNALNPHSGAETRIWNLNYALTNREFNVSVLHSVKSIGFENKDLKKKCTVFYNRQLGFFRFYLTDLNPFFTFKLLKIIRMQKLDIIQLEFPWGFLAAKILANKNTILIYDSQGIESEFMKIAIKHPEFPKIFRPFAKLFGKIYEMLVCKLANVIINVSDVDRNYYIEHYKIKKNKTILIQTPSTLSFEGNKRTEDYKTQCRKNLGLPLNKTIIIFHGGLPHPPNQEAFDLIINYIAPKIKNSNILFVIAGHNLEEFRKNNVISLGFVKNLREFLFAADFAIVPIISGSGMRIKCTDYIITALPFITTKIGIEGIEFVTPKEDYLVYEDVDENFLEGINLLYENKELREEIHKNLLKKSNFHNRNKFEDKFFKLYSYLKQS